MVTPATEVNIPEASITRLVCSHCLSGQWVGPTRVTVNVGDERTEHEVGGWHCGPCGGHKALLISSTELERRLAEQGEVTH